LTTMTSSFRRKTASSPAQERHINIAPGTRVSQSNPQVLLTSTGIPSLDDILGGGLQLGTDLLLLNPDPHSSHASLVQKYCISQGLASGHHVHVFDSDPKDIVASCMWKLDADSNSNPIQTSNEDDESDMTDDKVKIAWRYESMEKFKTTVSSPSSINDDFCEAFDLSSRIPSTVIERATTSGKLSYCDISSEEHTYETIACCIKGILAKTYDQASSNTGSVVVRLILPSFAGPLWGDPSSQKIISFLLRLRSLLRSYPLACAVFSLPSHLCNSTLSDSSWMDTLGWVSDACISLDAASADPSMAVVLPSHHGLVRIISLPRVQMLVPGSDRSSTLRGISASSLSSSSGGVGENNLAFKCTRRRLVFETFHLDVEGGVGERRTTPAATASTLGHALDGHRQEPAPLINDRATASIQVQVEKNVSEAKRDVQMQLANDNAGTKPQKKARRKVGFQTDKPDIYDF